MEFLIIAFLIVLNGIFSMSEIALVSSKRFKLENAVKKGNKGAKQALELSGSPNTFLSTVQIGITLIGILTGIFSGDRITENLELSLREITFLAPLADSLAVAIVVVVITFFSIVFGELIPKRIGLAYPETIAVAVSGPMRVISLVTKPFVWLLGITNDFFLRLLRIKENRSDSVSEEEINAMVKESAVAGLIDEIEHNIVKRVFALGDRKVRDLMTHRTELTWFDVDDDLQTIRQKAQTDKHSVYPLADGNLDKLLGIVYSNDLFVNIPPDNTFNIRSFCRKPLFIHENTRAYTLLEEFRKVGVHYAIIVDEYGSMEGMMTLNDVFDALVGEYPEYNEQEDAIVQRDEHSWLIDGQYSYFEFLRRFDMEEEEQEKGFTTIAGLILNILNHIPVTGEKVKWRDFELEVVDMDGQRIDKIMVTRSL